MPSKKEIEEKIMRKMQEAFSSSKDRKKAIHATAAAGAAIVAVLPIGLDAWALRIAECAMVCCIAGSYGEKLTISAAKGLMLSSFAQLAGEAVALSALEAAEASKAASAATLVGPLVAYGIKSSVAVGLIETVGFLVIKYYEQPHSAGAKACKAAETVGLAADVARIATAAADCSQAVIADNLDSGVSNALPAASSGEISFCGKKYTEKDLHDAELRLNSAKNNMHNYCGFLESDIRFDRDIAINSSRVKNAGIELKKAQEEYDKIKAAVRK